MMTCRECGATAPDGTAGWKTGPTGLHWCPDCQQRTAAAVVTTPSVTFGAGGGGNVQRRGPCVVVYAQQADGTSTARTLYGDDRPKRRWTTHGIDGIELHHEEDYPDGTELWECSGPASI